MRNALTSLQMRLDKKFLQGVLAITLVLICVTYAVRVTAFDPDAPDYGHSYITQSIAGAGYGGAGATQVPAFTATFVTTGGEIKFTKVNLVNLE